MNETNRKMNVAQKSSDTHARNGTDNLLCGTFMKKKAEGEVSLAQS